MGGFALGRTNTGACAWGAVGAIRVRHRTNTDLVRACSGLIELMERSSLKRSYQYDRERAGGACEGARRCRRRRAPPPLPPPSMPMRPWPPLASLPPRPALQPWLLLLLPPLLLLLLLLLRGHAFASCHMRPRQLWLSIFGTRPLPVLQVSWGSW